MKQTTGRQRAKARLDAKLKANKEIPSGERMTRQRRRAKIRAEAKRIISEAKQIAAKKRPGGAAAVHPSDLQFKEDSNV